MPHPRYPSLPASQFCLRDLAHPSRRTHARADICAKPAHVSRLRSRPHHPRASLAALAGFFALMGLGTALPAAAQTGPQLLPYTINPIAGGATAVCSGAADTVGDGCTAPNITLSTNLLGIALDGQNNLYIDDTTNNLLRRVDARTGLVTVAAGSLTTSTVCAAALDRYGDGCTATDGLANAAGGHTYLGKPYAIAIARNGDIFLTGTISLVQKISAATGIMTVVAGSTTPAGKTGAPVNGYTGDLGPATSATVNAPRGVAVDAFEDVFIADFTNNVIRVVYNGGPAAALQITAANPTVLTPVIGDIYTICGSQTGVSGAGVDPTGVPAATALLTTPADVAVDAAGNVFIEDDSKFVRMIYAGGGNIFGLTAPVVGNIYNVAGAGSTRGNTLTWVPGATTAMSVVRRILLDRRGNLYTSDQNQILWFEDRTTGYTRPIVGVFKGSTLPVGCSQQTDTLGDNCPATVATINVGVEGYGMTIDANSNLYVSDASAETIRKVSSNLSFPATTSTAPITQTIELHFPAGSGPATNPFVVTNPDFTAAAPSCVTNADTTQDCTAAITFTPSIPGIDHATLTVTDKLANSSTLGFNGTGTLPALSIDPGTAAAFGSGLNQPQAIARDGNGNLFLADTANNRVVRINLTTQTQTTIAGTGSAGYTGDNGPATAATLSAPRAVAIAADGTLYIADSANNAVRAVNPATGVITTFAGGTTTVCALANNSLGDGCLGPQAIFAAPSGLGLDASGLLYVADTGNNRIRTVPASPFGVLTVVGGGTICTAATDAVGDGCNALQSTLGKPSQLRFDATGNLYLADTANNLVRRVNLTTPGQTIVAVAGNGQAGGSGDGGAATAAQLNTPTAIALDGAANLYVADTKNDAIRMVDKTSGIITTHRRHQRCPRCRRSPGSATSILLNSPQGIEITGTGQLYLADTTNSRGLFIDRDSVQFNFGKVNVTQSSPTQPFLLTSTGTSNAGLGTPLTTATGSLTSFTFVPSTTAGCSAAQTLASGVQCSMTGQFTPLLNGNVSATYIFAAGTDVNIPAPSVTLLGGGATLVSTTSAIILTTPPTGNPQYGQTTAVTVTVTPATQGTSPISGTVTVLVDNVKQAPTAITINAAGSGVAVVTLPALTVGTHTINATYSGDAVYASSIAPVLVLTVTRAATATSVTAAPTAIIQFQTVTFTAVVASLTSGVPTGSVTFLNGTTALGSGNLNAQGVATLTSTTLPVGTYQLIAQYNGDPNFALSASSPALTFIVSPDPPDFSITPATSSLSVAQGGNVQATFTITPTNTLSGNVSVSCGGMPAFAQCTFQPQVFTFSTGVDAPVPVLVTFWTNITPGTTPMASTHLEPRRVWFAALGPIALLLLWVRRRRFAGPLGLAAALLYLAAVTGCSSQEPVAVITPGGTTTISIKATGPNGQFHTVPVTLTVTTSP